MCRLANATIDPVLMIGTALERPRVLLTHDDDDGDDDAEADETLKPTIK